MGTGDRNAMEPPLASLSLTHVYYNPHDPLSLLSAWLALVPQAIVISYAALLFGQREVELILMFAGQLGCEAVNWVLKRLIKEGRPSNYHGKGYGMPSSHAQFMAYFAIYVTLWVGLRNRHLPLPKKLAISLISLFLCASISLSRIYLNYHTPRQVFAGTCAGAVIGAAWFGVTAVLRCWGWRGLGGRTVWEWIMWAGEPFWVKDMCLDVDVVECEWRAWSGGKVKVR